ncbi:uncharacterized protein LOC135487740 [Lineus longissimus]|uniref:uncharacterized protein LOC135487740 n=1 Tax=Lineus longissimus TaxID=88925 RepID=UPI00315D842B
MKKLAGTGWGANARKLKQVYTGSVRPVMEYASQSWATTAKTNQAKLDKVQNFGLRIILGAMKSTPIADMERTAGIEPLEHRRNQKILIHGEKIRRLPSHPLHPKLEETPKNRLKRKSQNHLTKSLQDSASELLQPGNPVENLQPTAWSQQELRVEIQPSVPDLRSKGIQLPDIQKALTMEHIDRQYPHDRWTLAYTDGSAESAVKNGGSGIYIRYPCGESSTLSVPGGKYCSNFKAEVLAITTAAKHLAQSQMTSPLIAILTDSLSTLQALRSENIESEIKDLKEHLQDLTSNHHVVLQWIPAHCGIPGNERADQLAKEGSLQIQPNGKQSYREITTLLKQKCRNDWKKIQGNHHPQSDQLWLLDRKDATTIYRLRTGHCGLRGHLKRIGVRDTA